MFSGNEQRSERFLSGLILTALGLLVGGGIGAIIFVAPSFRLLHAASVVAAFMGVLLLGTGVFWGLWQVANRHAGPEIREDNCRVMARYGVDARNEVVAADWIYDGEDIRMYVRLWSPTRGAQEFECAYPVWCQCGEGMRGHAMTRGRWLSGFFPQNGPPV